MFFDFILIMANQQKHLLFISLPIVGKNWSFIMRIYKYNHIKRVIFPGAVWNAGQLYPVACGPNCVEKTSDMIYCIHQDSMNG